jgi:hypothetical protein
MLLPVQCRVSTRALVMSPLWRYCVCVMLGDGHLKAQQMWRKCTVAQRVLSIFAALLFVLGASQADFTKSPSGHRLVDRASAFEALQPKLAAIRQIRPLTDESGLSPGPAVQLSPTSVPSGVCTVVLPTTQCVDAFARLVSWDARAPPKTIMRTAT